MEKTSNTLFLKIVLVFLCKTGFGQNWPVIKDTVFPNIELISEYDTAYRQPLSNLGWEDGVHISNDGLSLYCTYVPIDLLSFSLNGDLPNNFSSNYDRGAPDFGMDLVSNPIGSSEWLQSDILYSSRTSIADSFVSWQLSDMSRTFYSEGAPTPLFQNNSNSIEIMLFTSNDNPTNNIDIWTIENTSTNPSGVGAAMPSPLNTSFNEDNPHLVKLQGDTLIMMFDSDNLPGGSGSIDIWYTLSYDNGGSWHTPLNVSSVNTASKEHQPFLYYDIAKASYYLYYSAYHLDGKLAIFRRKQTITNNWNSWGASELVISAGNSAGIGEPTLTQNGDLSFVLIYEDLEMNSTYDRFDSDPWLLRKKDETLGVDNSSFYKGQVSVFSNPASEKLYIKSQTPFSLVRVYNSLGQLYYSGNETMIDIKDFDNGIYLLSISTESGDQMNKVFIKH